MFKVNYQVINEDNNFILNKNLFTFTHQIEIGMNSQGCCLTGALLPEMPMIPRLQFTLGQPKFQTERANG